MSEAVYRWEHDPNLDLDDSLFREITVANMAYYKKHLSQTHFADEGWLDSLELTDEDRAQIIIDKYKIGVAQVRSNPNMKIFGFRQYRNEYLVGLWLGWLQPYGQTPVTGPLPDDGIYDCYGLGSAIREDENGSRDWAMYETHLMDGLKDFLAQHNILSYKTRLVDGHGHINRLKSKFNRDYDYVTQDVEGRTRYIYDWCQQGLVPPPPA